MVKMAVAARTEKDRRVAERSSMEFCIKSPVLLNETKNSGFVIVCEFPSNRLFVGEIAKVKTIGVRDPISCYKKLGITN